MDITIIEDEKEQQELLKTFLRKYLNEKMLPYQITTYKNGESFLKEYRQGKADLIFMDIQLGEGHENGMEISKALRKIDNDVLLVFVTNMSQFAVEGYSVDAIDFIVKPIQYEPFRMKMEKACHLLLSKSHMKNILISVEGGSKKILAGDILYVEVSNHDLYYHTKNGEYKVRMTLRNALEQLEGLPFSQCNSCYLVNLHYVEKIEKEYVILSNGESLKMPRTRRKDFLADLGDYLSGAKQ